MKPEFTPRTPIAKKTPGYHRRYSGEMLVIGIIFILLVTAIWFSFSGKPGDVKSFEDPEIEKQMLRQLARARSQLQRDYLTWPPGDNALETYQQILHVNPRAFIARRGIESLGNRYVAMARLHLEHRDFRLATATLQSAEKLLPHIAGMSFKTELKDVNREIEQLKQTLIAKRQPPASTTTPLHKLRDKLVDGSLGPELIVIPAGVFMLGSPDSEAGRDSDEGPQFKVDIKPFAIGQTEVTFAEYERFASATGYAIPSDNGWGRDDRPVINISWRDAKKYLAWLSDQTGFIYRLTTEKEWEYAARAGTSTTFHSGDCLNVDDANIDNTQPYSNCPSSAEKAGKTLPVKSFLPNSWGLHDMHGNVREILEDCWFPIYDPANMKDGPRYATELGTCGPGGQRIARGGAWSAEAKSARSANRYAVSDRESGTEFGFRLVRDIE